MKKPIIRWAPLAAVPLLLAACAQSAPSDAPRLSETTTTTEDETSAVVPAQSTVDRYAGAPASADKIAGLLMARHKEDLPGKEKLAHYEDAEESLAWLAEHGGRMVLRVRALALLRFYTGETTRKVLLDVLTSPDAHPALVAAAITGSGGFELERDATLRAAVEDAGRHDDPRIARALEQRHKLSSPSK
jgi:hypothetical protein